MSRLRRAAARIAAPALATAALAGGIAAPAAHATTWPMPAWPAGPYAHPTWSQLAGLQQCESGGNYAIDTGNGFYGAYQFNLATWHSLGLPGAPNEAPPAVQDRAAAVLEVQRGWAPWPACSRALGLTARPASTARPAATRQQHIEASVADASISYGQLAWVGGSLAPARPGTVMYLQRRFADGWHTVDLARTNDHSDYLFSLRPAHRGVNDFRVVARRAGDLATAVTPALPITVS